jgi:hypothetical protein
VLKNGEKMEKGLIIVHREESAEDFKEIAKRIKQLDPTIKGAMVSEWIFEERFPEQFFNMPLLVVYLVNPPKTSPDQFVFPNAKNIMVAELTKLEEYQHFKKHNLPCLPIQKFEWGMQLDNSTYGNWVVLKPAHLQSTGKDVNMIPTKVVSDLKISDFPKEHLIHQDDYFVQKFVRTGLSPVCYRVLNFLGNIILSYKVTKDEPYPDTASNLDILLTKSVASNLRGERKLELTKDQKIIDIATKVALSLSDSPLIGVDIIPDAEGNFYVLEINAGGNTWAFSNKPGENFRSVVGLANMIGQYGVWDLAAEALVKKTQDLLM